MAAIGNFQQPYNLLLFLLFLLPTLTKGFTNIIHSQRPILKRAFVVGVLGAVFDNDNSYTDHDNSPFDAQMPPMEIPGEEMYYDGEIDQLSDLTVSQLKQQLRLRGLKVSGRKHELQARLASVLSPPEDTPKDDNSKEKHPDVTEYLEDDDKGKMFKTMDIQDAQILDEDDESSRDDATNEIWGSDARILPENNTQRIIVDALSQTTMEFRGANQTYVRATVIASRDALRPYMRGENATIPTEQRLRDIQLERENQIKRPVREDEIEGLDEGDETGIYEHALYRETSDWGKFTATGAQLSAQEVQGVLLLPDVYGMESNDMIALAEKIAFECQPVVVMIPDIFRGNPWVGDTNDRNPRGQTYEEWRDSHTAQRVSVDIRAAAACLRDTYRVSSVVLWGLCYGGGRALEEASGYLTSVHDIDGTSVAPPRVDPSVVIVFYPTRYKVANLFGANRKEKSGKMAVMGIFAGNVKIPGATKEDAAALKTLLEEDDRVVDHMIKVFPGKDHGFAHIGMSQQEFESEDPTERFIDEEFGGAGKLSVEDSDSEVACLLSTAFMDTYSRVFLPTVGLPIAKNEIDKDWAEQLEMKDLSNSYARDVRTEIQDALNSHTDEALESGTRIDPLDKDQEEELMRLLRSMESPDQPESLKITDDDDLATMYAKLTTGDENFQLW